MRDLVAFTGKARAGKDTSANVLVDHYGFTRSAFAYKVKTCSNEMFNILDTRDSQKEVKFSTHVYSANVFHELRKLGVSNPDHQQQLNEKLFAALKQKGLVTAESDAGVFVSLTPRQAYQVVGTEVFREYDPDFWVNRIHRHQKTVITDLRFDNEAEYVRRNGGVVIEVVNPRIVSTDSHASESGISREYVDHVVMNDSTIEMLEEKIQWVLEAL